MSVFDGLVGQRPVIDTLRRAAAGDGMTHAWLFTGPPGSGRSNAALAFAAALQCSRGGGCGECHECVTALAGSHPDIHVTRTETSTIKIEAARELVLKAATMPSLGRWQVMIVEDADRLGKQDDTRASGNALLKAIEEPTPRTVWLLCAPTVEDVLPTIRSRCRSVVLTTPTADDVSRFLQQRVGVPDSVAAYAARASQGHIGRARALATDERTRNRRNEVVRLPTALVDLGSCLTAAENLVDIAKDETTSITDAANAKEVGDLQAIYGSDPKSRGSRSYKAAQREMLDDQKQREKRRILDVIDRCLMDLLSVYRDVIAVQTGTVGTLVNEEIAGDIHDLARRTTPESNLRRTSAVFEARDQMLLFNTPPLLALESMMVSLKV
jgi:DNA polymerase III subunit delta'